MTLLETTSNEPIEIVLSSEGGAAYDALAISARIRSSQCAISVAAYGLVASAAVIVLASGDPGSRTMAKEAWVMVHEDDGSLTPGSDSQVSDMRRVVGRMDAYTAHLERMEDQWAALLANLTKTPASKWRELHKKTTYLTAKECLKLGLIDRMF